MPKHQETGLHAGLAMSFNIGKRLVGSVPGRDSGQGLPSRMSSRRMPPNSHLFLEPQ